MVYGARHRVDQQVRRHTDLAPLWQQLRRLQAPEPCKWAALQQCFWQRAYHAIGICPLGWDHTRKLRSEAMKAMRYKKAGASPALRLFLLCPPGCDPGFFQLWTVMTTFLRMLSKHPTISAEWEAYMAAYDGRSTHGPFYKLVEQCTLIHWTVEPPGLRDHFGLWHSLLEIDKTHLRTLLLDAWQEQVFREVEPRKDFAGHCGLDRFALESAHQRASPLDLSLIKCQQDGSFLEPSQHQKFDLTVTCRCTLCGEADSLEHRTRGCPRLALPERSDIADAEWDTWSYAKRHHILPGRNPWWPDFVRAVHHSAACREVRGCPNMQSCHLFLDGSSNGGRITAYSLGAWAVVDPLQDTWVLRGCLRGLHQTSDRAELEAAIAATEYSLECAEVCLWTDSAYVAEGMVRLLSNPWDVPDTSNHSRWQDLANLLRARTGPLRIQHVPGHSPVYMQDNDIRDWAARWNDRADREAVAAQLYRHKTELDRASPVQQDDEDEAPPRVDRECPSDVMNPFVAYDAAWLLTPAAGPLYLKFGHTFPAQFMEFLMEKVLDFACRPQAVSYLELAVLLGAHSPDWLPVPSDQTKNQWQDGVWHSEPALAALVRLVRTFFVELSTHFDFVWIRAQNLTQLRLFTPQNGLALPISSTADHRSKDILLRLTGRRPIRTVLQRLGFHMVLQIHDELVLEGPEEFAEEALEELVRIMQDPLPKAFGPMKVPLLVDACHVQSWFHAKG
eukprot:Skav205571  [mRNA]  locus=scaffold1407:224061:227542:- [translate_table: standard]